MEAMKKLHNDDLGKLLVRIAIGGLMLFHGVSKVLSGPGQIIDIGESKQLAVLRRLRRIHWRSGRAGVRAIGHLDAPCGVCNGDQHDCCRRFATSRSDFYIGQNVWHWAIELPALYFLGSLALIFLGAGRYSFFRGQGTLD